MRASCSRVGRLVNWVQVLPGGSGCGAHRSLGGQAGLRHRAQRPKCERRAVTPTRAGQGGSGPLVSTTCPPAAFASCGLYLRRFEVFAGC